MDTGSDIYFKLDLTNVLLTVVSSKRMFPFYFSLYLYVVILKYVGMFDEIL